MKIEGPPNIMFKANVITRKKLAAIVEYRRRGTFTEQEITASTVLRALITEEFSRKKLSIFPE